jgi:hypothetical protein
MDWPMWSTIAAWVSIVLGLVGYIYFRGKKDGAINERISAIEQVRRHDDQLVTVAEFDRRHVDCKDELEKTVKSFKLEVSSIHNRLDAMDRKREVAGSKRNEQLGKLYDQQGDMRSTLAGVSSSVASMQKTFDLLLENYLKSEGD